MSHKKKPNRNRQSTAPFKKPDNVVIVSHPENRTHSNKSRRVPRKDNARKNRLRQIQETTVPRPKEPAYERIMDICGWMRDDGFISNELHTDIYKPAADDDRARLMKNAKAHIKDGEPKLRSYLEMLLSILEETDTGTSRAR